MSKYRAVRVGKYASKREAARAAQLKLMEQAGVITGLCEQVAYILAPSVVIQGRKRPPMRYVCDFEYMQDGKMITEDVKGMKTPIYIAKRHLMKAIHSIDILET